MAKVLKCPSCGSNMELDKAKEFAICDYCGCKVQLNETVKVKHSFDRSEEAENNRVLANRAFASANYIDSKKYYQKVLEVFPNDIEALYKKAISIMYLKIDAESTLHEFSILLEEVKNNINDNADNKETWIEISEYIENLFEYMERTYGKILTYAKKNECANIINGWAIMLTFIDISVPYIYEPLIRGRKAKAGIEYAKKIRGISRITYKEKSGGKEITRSFPVSTNMKTLADEIIKDLTKVLEELPDEVKSVFAAEEAERLEKQKKNNRVILIVIAIFVAVCILITGIGIIFGSNETPKENSGVSVEIIE